MPITTTSQTLFDGLKSAVQQFTGYSADGAGETNVVKVDVSAMTPPCAKVMPTTITYDVKGGGIALSWGGNASPEEFLRLSGQGCLDYRRINGLPNGNDDPTGDILLSTYDFDLQSSYSLTIDMKKKS